MTDAPRATLREIAEAFVHEQCGPKKDAAFHRVLRQVLKFADAVQSQGAARQPELLAERAVRLHEALKSSLNPIQVIFSELQAVQFLKLYAEKVQAGTDLQWEIPSVRANTLRVCAEQLAEGATRLMALERELAKILELRDAEVDGARPLIEFFNDPSDFARSLAARLIVSRDELKHKNRKAEADLAACVSRLKELETAPYNGEAEWQKLQRGAIAADPAVSDVDKAMAFLRIWANSYLLHGNYWDVPHTMGAVLNQVIKKLEADQESCVSRLEQEQAHHEDEVEQLDELLTATRAQLQAVSSRLRAQHAQIALIHLNWEGLRESGALKLLDGFGCEGYVRIINEALAAIRSETP